MDGAGGTTAPAIGVVIPALDRAGTVERAVRSALDQGVDVEVVVVDDGSTDGTAEVVEAIGDPRVRVVRQPNRGVGAARNVGVAHLTAPHVVFLDADDELLPGALERYLAHLAAGAPLVRAAVVVDRGGDATTTPAEAPDPVRPHPRGTKLPGSFALPVRELRAVGGYVPGLRFGENTELLLRLAERAGRLGWRVPVLDEPAARIHRQDEGRAQRYGSAQAEAAAYLLRRHRRALRADPQVHHDYLGLVGVHELRQGRRAAALRHLVRAVAARPGSAKGWARVGRAALLPAPAPAERPLVAVVSPGGGRIRRGYEAFAADITEQPGRRHDVDVVLLQGGPGPTPTVRRIPHLDRHRRPARLLARLTPFYPTTVEHYSFGVAALPTLLRRPPQAVLLSERPLANLWGVVLGRLGTGTRIVLRNGGSHRPPFRHVDAVIHHTPAYLEAALAAEGEVARHVHIPYAFELRPEPPARPSGAELADRRAALGLPPDRPVVVSVGAIDRTVKRMDHVVAEVAALADLEPFLLLLGQREAETPEVERLAAERLAPGSWRTATVLPSEVAEHLLVADAFVLASPREGFGRVYVEALAAGLPAVVHDTPHTRWVLGEHGTYVDMHEPGLAAAALRGVLTDPGAVAEPVRRARAAWVHDRYSWERLLPRYLDALGLGAPSGAAG